MGAIAIFLCDLTGNMARPWAAAGYECWCVDIQHSIRRDREERVDGRGVIRFVWGDVRSWCPPSSVRPDFVAAFPPCTDVSGSGARDWRRKGHYRLTDALELFTACEVAASWSGAPYCIENPVGALSNHMGAPTHTFHPAEYAGYAKDPAAEAYTKKTCLWTGNGFVMPDRKPVAPVLGTMMHRLPPSPDRANLRSATPTGFAMAVFLANNQAARLYGAAA
jgi:hypothetical protein